MMVIPQWVPTFSICHGKSRVRYAVFPYVYLPMNSSESTPSSLPVELERLLLQVGQDAKEHELGAEELEAIWSMGLSAYLTGKSYGLRSAPAG
jgi:hypothetical protein